MGVVAVGVCMTPTWPNGTPRSTGNAFDVLYEVKAAKVLTKAEIDLERRRRHATAANARRKAKNILRDNHNHSFAVTLPSQSDRDKTARIQGRP